MNIKTNPIFPEMCECGRMYKDRFDKVSGKFMCSACFTGLTEQELKLLWGTPMPKKIECLWKK